VVNLFDVGWVVVGCASVQVFLDRIFLVFRMGDYRGGIAAGLHALSADMVCFTRGHSGVYYWLQSWFARDDRSFGYK